MIKIGAWEFDEGAIDIIEPTIEAMNEFGYAWGASCEAITEQQLNALKEGKILAYDGGEYNTFFILKKEN